MTEPRRPDNIPGYEHPDATNYSRQGIYKTFTEGKKIRKIEKFGTTTAGKQYSTYGAYRKTMEEDMEDDICPVCSEEPIQTCPCGYSDKKCSSGHVWHTNRDGVVKLGNPHVQNYTKN